MVVKTAKEPREPEQLYYPSWALQSSSASVPIALSLPDPSLKTEKGLDNPLHPGSFEAVCQTCQQSSTHPPKGRVGDKTKVVYRDGCKDALLRRKHTPASFKLGINHCLDPAIFQLTGHLTTRKGKGPEHKWPGSQAEEPSPHPQDQVAQTPSR